MNDVDVKFCRHCKYSFDASSGMRCMHSKVIFSDPTALASTSDTGSCARTERSRNQDMSPTFGCGMAGKLWEPKE